VTALKEEVIDLCSHSVVGGPALRRTSEAIIDGVNEVMRLLLAGGTVSPFVTAKEVEKNQRSDASGGWETKTRRSGTRGIRRGAKTGRTRQDGAWGESSNDA